MTRTVEAVGAELALGQADGIDKGIHGVELQRGEVEAAADFLYQALILRCTGSRVFVEVLAIVALKLLNDAAGKQFEVAL